MVRLPTAAALIFASLVVGQECPANPGTDPNEPGFEEGAPPNPDDIPTGCSDYEVLSARGTAEIGKFGYRVGDPVIGNVTETLPGARGYPVQYPANIDFDNGVAAGAQDVVDRINTQSEACPDQTFALIGYSQGAMVVRAALELLDEAAGEKVKSIVLFGDPYYQDAIAEPFAERTLENCATGDNVCDKSGTLCPYGHISYTFPEWVEASEAWIVDGFASE